MKYDTSSAELTQHFSVFLYEDENKRCKNPEHYESFIKYRASIDMEQGLGVTYMYIERDDKTNKDTLAGYMTLRTSCLIKDDLGGKEKHGYPALEIAELSVADGYGGTGLGTDMVLDAINIANEINDICSIKYIVLCADRGAEEFYKKKPLNFRNINECYESIPREQGNQDCIPMYLKLR